MLKDDRRVFPLAITYERGKREYRWKKFNILNT